ncbi:MAG: hypothetical protein KAJ36_05290, partial [Candidatus Thorarchaeota archaeon]|nr:hypothetical protein [Candidatus Thorarchaeota archaeon]
MGEKAKVKETVRLYTKIVKLPTYRGILTIHVILTTCISFLSAAVKTLTAVTVDFYGTWFMYLLLLGIPVLLGTSLLYLIGSSEGSPLDTRRTAGATMFGFIVWYILSIIGVAVDAILATQVYEIK